MTTTAELVWDIDEHDGLIFGLCRYAGELCWFAARDSEQGPWEVYALTDEQAKEVLAHKRDFEFYVGTDFSYDIPPERRVRRGAAMRRSYFAGRRQFPIRYSYVNSSAHAGTVTTLVDPYAPAG